VKYLAAKGVELYLENVSPPHPLRCERKAADAGKKPCVGHVESEIREWDVGVAGVEPAFLGATQRLIQLVDTPGVARLRWHCWPARRSYPVP
jgi:hypothetical protein